MNAIEVKSNHPECDNCVRTKDDGYWCETHSSPIGDSYDGWAGCTKALAADMRAFADAFEKADAEAQEFIATAESTSEDYAKYEQAQIAQVEPGLAISAFLLRLDEAEE